ncbi:MAG: Hsp20/alpha crystallin family protein [Planctomycetaceae bacterium]|nr:Hsp20/alpha crystallin family protein [Planctomycetaceae bacterium]
MSQLVKTDKQDVAGQNQEQREKRKFRFPVVDISEHENEFVIEADMPGTCEKNIDVQYHHGELTIQGKIEPCDEKCPSEKNWRFRQFEPHDYYRAFRIGESVNAEKISARYEDGVLTVHLPKAESLKPRKIDVSKK